MSLVIRDATPADAAALAHVIVTATRHTFTGLVPDVYVTWLSADEQAACPRTGHGRWPRFGRGAGAGGRRQERRKLAKKLCGRTGSQ